MPRSEPTRPCCETDDDERRASRTCPVCDQTGRRVARITLESLLTDTARARLDEAGDSWRFCRSPDCPVVYFDEHSPRIRFTRDEVRVEVFQKSDDPARRVCYCFEHTVQSIEAEVARHGRSDVAERIAAGCRRGLDRCPETNPQGACCLGNVRAILRRAR